MRNPLAAAIFIFVSALPASAAPAPTIDPPPGWRDVLPEGKVQDSVIALKGPETSSFIVKRAPSVALDNPANVRGFLNDVYMGLREASGKDYKTTGRIETRVFRNGLSVQLLRGAINGDERLVIAAFSASGVPHIAVLQSAAPEAMLPSLLGALRVGALDGAVQTSGAARSLDGQLELALGGGLRARSLVDAEMSKGFVLVIQGAGSEIIFQKIAEAEATKPAEQAAIVREMAAATAGVGADKTAPVRAAPTAAGPVAVYSWAPAPGGEKLSVGYLPWGYWGYQLYGRGPAADELMVGVLAALKAGPSAVPGLLASSPRIPIKEELSRRKLMLGGVAAAAGLGAVMLLIWSLKRKNANLPA